LDVDCFLADDEIYILEMNCRFGGQYPFSHLSGVDFPAQIIRWVNNLSTENELITPQIGIIACKEILPVVL
jgi:carbamoyl-phosphate synthase large subunit